MGDTASTPALPSALRLLGQPSKPGPGDRVAQRVFQVEMRADLPSQWSANKVEQTNHFTGVVSIAIKPYLDAIGGAKFTLLERKTPETRNRARGAPLLKAGAPVDLLERYLKSTSGTGHYSRDDEYEPADPDHPLCKVLEMPGGEEGVWSMGQECAYLALQNLLTGDAPAWAPRNEAGKPVQFYALTAATVQAQIGVSEMYPNGYYRVTPYTGVSGLYFGGLSAASVLLPGEELSRFKDPHPWARNWGMSRLQSGALEIDVLEAITRSRWTYFDQGLQLDSVIFVPGADEANCQKLEADLVNKRGGARNARKVLVVGGGGAMDQGGKPLTIQQLGPGARELDFTASYEQAAKVVLALFKVPGVLSGLTEGGSNYAADWAAQRRFYDLGLQPYARNLGVFLTQCLAKPWCETPGQYKIEVEIHEPKNVEEEAKERQFAVQQGITLVNEYRVSTGRKPVPDGDLVLSAYVAKANQAVAPQPDPAQSPQDGAPPEEGDDAQPDADPLAALMGGGAPPDNPDGEGSLPGRPPVVKALTEWTIETFQKARKANPNATHPVGTPYQTTGGRWMVNKQFGDKVRAVPSANPNKAKPEPKGPKGPTKKDQAAQAKQQKQADAAKVASAAEKLAKGGDGLTHEEVQHLDQHFATLPQAKMKEVAKALGAKLSGTKKDLAGRLMDEARKRVAGGAKSEIGPASEPKEPGASTAGNHEATALDLMYDGLKGEYANLRMVPIHAVRAAFVKKHPEATHEDFNEAMLSIRRKGQAQLVPIDDPAKHPADQLRDSVHAVGETMFYMEPTAATPARRPKDQPRASQSPESQPAKTARSALDALGIDHSRHSDEEVVAKLRAAFAPAQQPDKPVESPSGNATGKPTKSKPAPKTKTAPNASPAPAKPSVTPDKAKATLPAGQEHAGDIPGGAVVGRDAKTGNLTTHFAPGEPERQAAKLGKPIKDAMDDLRLFPEFEDGLISVHRIVHDVQREHPDATTTDVIAALSHMQDTRDVEMQGVNEVQKMVSGQLTGTKPLPGAKDIATAALWKNGKALGFALLPKNR